MRRKTIKVYEIICAGKEKYQKMKKISDKIMSITDLWVCKGKAPRFIPPCVYVVVNYYNCYSSVLVVIHYFF